MSEVGTGAQRLGAALFRARGWIPVPAVLLLAWTARPPGGWALPGAALILCGLVLRAWAVAHIGPGSRRRSGDVGALACTGPYARCRNPLYLGNLLLWAGVGLVGGSPGVALLVVSALALHYALVVRWEEARLAEALGEPYRAWAARTPRWLPFGGPAGEAPGDWRAAWKSERSTRLAALAVLGAVLGAGILRGPS